MSGFELFSSETHFWSFSDYATVMNVVRRLGASRVLEFGPGSSTLALIEGGAAHIETCEDDPAWADVYQQRLAGRFPKMVHLRRYIWSDPVSVPSVDGQRFDLALIDGPHDIQRRLPVLWYCLSRATRVLLAMDDRAVFQPALDSMRGICVIETIETGPPSGCFVLLGPRSEAA